MSLVVLGTSISFGQGLRTADKFSTLVGRELQLPVRSYAHSGATLWDPRGESYPLSAQEAYGRLDLRSALAAKVNPADGERPSSQPFLWGQLRAAWHEQRPDVVLVDVGANDVDFIKQIVTPDRRASEVADEIDGRLKRPTEMFLRAVLESFPAATVVVTSYYEAFTSSSELYKTDLGWFLGSLFGACVPRTAITNSTAFKVAFDRLISGACDRIDDNRLRFAPVDFGFDNGLFTGRSMLWEPGHAGAPTDDAAEGRRMLARGGMVDREICLRASIGHPNVQGARRYADAILSVLR